MQQQMLPCPNCGAQNAASQQFCISCGAHLGPQVKAPHVPIVTGIAAAPAPAVGIPTVPQAMVTPVLPPPVQSVDNITVKPTWSLAWGLLWRILILEVFLAGIGFLIYMLVRMILGYNSVFGPF